jgi:DNA polymerase-3 subunit beta
MKFTIQNHDFRKLLSDAGLAVATRTSLPVLTNMLFVAKNGKLQVSGSNLELSISVSAPADVIQEGAVTLPARTLIDLVAALPTSAPVSIEVNDRNIADFSCGTTKAKINGIDASEFPTLINEDLGEGMHISTEDFKTSVSQVSYASAKDDNRPVLTGVFIKIVGETATFVGLDGNRLSEKVVNVKNSPLDGKAIIAPSQSVAKFLKTLGDTDSIKMHITGSKAVWVGENLQVAVQLIEGNFPDYKIIIPKTVVTKVTISTIDLKNACRGVNVFARDAGYVVKVSVNSDSITLKAIAAELGENETVVPAQTEGPDVDFSINVSYLQETLDTLHSEFTEIDLTDGKSPVVLKPVEGEALTGIIMPLSYS